MLNRVQEALKNANRDGDDMMWNGGDIYGNGENEEEDDDGIEMPRAAPQSAPRQQPQPQPAPPQRVLRRARSLGADPQPTEQDLAFYQRWMLAQLDSPDMQAALRARVGQMLQDPAFAAEVKQASKPYWPFMIALGVGFGFVGAWLYDKWRGSSGGVLTKAVKLLV